MRRAGVWLVVAATAALLPSGVRGVARQAQAGAYLNQQPPGNVPVVFAPGIVSTGLFERDMAVSPDGRQIYWTVTSPGREHTTIVKSVIEDGKWTSPEVASFATDPAFGHIEPAISPDGAHFYFTLVRHDETGRTVRAALRVMDRKDGGWTSPRDPGTPINGDWDVYFPSLTRDGWLYFTRESRAGTEDGIYRSRMNGERYSEPERLPSQVNGGTARFNACVHPAGRYLVVPMQGRPDSTGGIDYYVVFHREDDTWSEPINLGPGINTPGSGEYSPYISPDGRYFFFMSSRLAAKADSFSYRFFTELLSRPGNGNADIYWMDARVIDALRGVK